MIRLPDPGDLPISLWLVDLEAASSANDLTALDTLSCAQRHRANRFHHAHDARRYVARHQALRLLLAEATHIAPEDLQFVEGEHGKPLLRLNNPPHFNMSHSGGWALIGICSDASIGVDIELPRPIQDLTALAKRSLSSAEMTDLAGLPEGRQTSAFLQCWTRKEACLKAIGSGLSIEPGTFDAGIEKEMRVVSVDGQRDADNAAQVLVGS